MTNENIFEESPQATPQEQTFAVTVDGEELRLTLPQLLEAAQAGLTKRSEAIRRDAAAAQMPGGNVYAEFLAEYPEVAPADIPAEVWQAAEREGSLVSAYRKYELETLRMELAALRKNYENEEQQIGAAGGDGDTPDGDPVIRALLGR